MAENTANNIDDANVKAAVLTTVNAQESSFTTNVEILGFLNQYAWVFIAIIILFVLFVNARRMVETQGIY